MLSEEEEKSPTQLTPKSLVQQYLYDVVYHAENISQFYKYYSRVCELNRAEVLPPLVEALTQPEDPIRMASAVTLLGMGAYRTTSIGVITDIFRRSSVTHRIFLCTLLSGCPNDDPGWSRPEGVGAPGDEFDALFEELKGLILRFVRTDQRKLCAHLRKNYPEVAPSDYEATWWWCRVTGAAALARFRPDAETLAILRGALYGPVPAVKMLAGNALMHVGQHREEAMRALVEGLRDPDPDFQLMIIVFILTHGAAANVAVPALVKLVTAPSTADNVRLAAVRALGEVGKDSMPGSESARALKGVVLSGNWLNACLGMQALKGLQGQKGLRDEHFEALIQLLRAADPAIRHTAASTLAEFGPRIKKYVPALIERARAEASEKDSSMFWAIAGAIARVGEAAIPALLEVAQEGDPTLLAMAGVALATIGPGAFERLAETLLEHREGWLRKRFADCLRGLGHHAAAAVPVAICVLRGDDRDKRRDAVIAVGAIGRDAHEAVPELVRALLDDDPHLGEDAASALVSVGSTAAEALRDAYPNAGPDARERIRYVLGQLDRSTARDKSEADLSWIQDTVLLESFAEMGLILKDRPASFAEIARIFKEKERQGGLGKGIAKPESTIRMRLQRLEKLLSAKNGRAIQLRERDSTRKSGLTDDGLQFLSSVQAYLHKT